MLKDLLESIYVYGSVSSLPLTSGGRLKCIHVCVTYGAAVGKSRRGIFTYSLITTKVLAPTFTISTLG